MLPCVESKQLRENARDYTSRQSVSALDRVSLCFVAKDASYVGAGSSTTGLSAVSANLCFLLQRVLSFVSATLV